MNWKDKCDASVLLWSRTPKCAWAPSGKQSRKMEPGMEHHLWSSEQQGRLCDGWAARGHPRDPP